MGFSAAVLASAGLLLGRAQGMAPPVLGNNSRESIAIPPAAGPGESPDSVRCFNISALSPSSFPSASLGREPEVAPSSEATGNAATPAGSVPVASPAPETTNISAASTAAPGTAAPVQERSGGAAVSLSALFTWLALAAALAALLA